MRLSEPAFALPGNRKEKWEFWPHAAFSATAAVLKRKRVCRSGIYCRRSLPFSATTGGCNSDLGAIGKGVCAGPHGGSCCGSWDCFSFLLVSGRQQASWRAMRRRKPPAGSCGLGMSHASQRFFLTYTSLSGSGLAVKGNHILDPRTGQPRPCGKTVLWALADTGC